MIHDIENLKIGESTVLDLSVLECKEQLKGIKENKNFKFISINSKKTTVVRAPNRKTIKGNIIDRIEDGSIYAGCFINGSPKYIKKVIKIINLGLEDKISYKTIDGKIYAIQDIAAKETITLDQFKLISTAYTNKLEELEQKIEI